MSRLLIVNPYASGVTERRLAAVERALPRGTETVLTERAGHAAELARDCPPTLAALYVFSGDGTVNEVLNGLRADIPVGLVPGGGTSVMPRALGLPRDPAAAAAVLARGRTRRIALGRVNGRRFGFSAGLGFDAELVRRVDALGRRADGKRPGDLAFLLTGIRLLAAHGWTLEPILEIEGVGRAALCLGANCDPYTYAGALAMHFAPEARFEGGLEVVAPPRLGVLGVASFLLAAPVARGAGPRSVVAHDADRVAVRCDRPTALQVDGEDLGDVDGVVLEAERDAVTVLV